MRILFATMFLAATSMSASAEFYVVQNTQTLKCSIEQSLPESATTQILLNNRFNDRVDAEAAMKDVPSCN